MTPYELLLEVEDLLRTRPKSIRDHSEASLEWIGRAGALIELWNPQHSPAFNLHYACALMNDVTLAYQGIDKVLALVYQMRSDLVLKTRGPLSTPIAHGMVFDYFDELRKIIQLAREDVLFVDPFLDADFVGRYLPHVDPSASIRLLARERMPSLISAVKLFVQQSSLPVQVRSAPGFHDRYVFIDKTACYQSGASFKDGGRTAPTTLTQITDAFDAVHSTYETKWAQGKVEA